MRVAGVVTEAMAVGVDMEVMVDGAVKEVDGVGDVKWGLHIKNEKILRLQQLQQQQQQHWHSNHNKYFVFMLLFVRRLNAEWKYHNGRILIHICTKYFFFQKHWSKYKFLCNNQSFALLIVDAPEIPYLKFPLW
jgi:hypothetical protein